MDRLRIQRYVHRRPELSDGELDWRETRIHLAAYALYVNSLLHHASRINGGFLCGWSHELSDSYEVLRIDPATDRPVNRYPMDFVHVFTLDPFGMYNISPIFMKLNILFSHCIRYIFKEDHDDVLLFNPVCQERHWYALYLDIDDLRVSSSDLLANIDRPDNNEVPFLRPRHESLLWRQIVEKYRGDEELLRFIYYDTLWYHTGRGIHFVCYDRWSRYIFNDPRKDWLDLVGCTLGEWLSREKARLSHRDPDSEIAELRARLRSDSDQYVGLNMKVRLAGSTNPRTGDIALGFLHPYAFPYHSLFIESWLSLKTDGIWGLIPFRYRHLRAGFPLPEPIEDENEGRRFLSESPISVALAGESMYLLLARWGRKTRRIVDEKDKRDVGLFIARHRLNLLEILREEGIDAVQGRKVIDLNRYARMTEKFRTPVAVTSEKTERKIVTLWRWELEFDAAPFGAGIAQKLDLEDYLAVSEGRARIENVYTSELPSFLHTGKLKYSVNFRSFRMKLYREDVPEPVAMGKRVVPLERMETVLGIRDMIELEWSVLASVRSSNRMSDLTAFIWLNHLKRIRYNDGIVPQEEASQYLMREVGWSASHTRSRLRRLERTGWITPVRKGYIVHSWVTVARLLGVCCDRVVLVNKDEVRGVKGLKCVAASLPGTFGEPLIKFEIAKRLNVSIPTVKRNRRGRLREWYTVCYTREYRTYQQAEEARVTEHHPKHGWPLCLCGYRSAPAKLDDERWVLERSSAARILDLTCVSLIGKSRRLRRATSNLANKGGGVSESSVVTWRVMDESGRCTNFSCETSTNEVMEEKRVGSAFRPLKRRGSSPALSTSSGGFGSSLSVRGNAGGGGRCR